MCGPALPGVASVGRPVSSTVDDPLSSARCPHCTVIGPAGPGQDGAGDVRGSPLAPAPSVAFQRATRFKAARAAWRSSSPSASKCWPTARRPASGDHAVEPDPAARVALDPVPRDAQPPHRLADLGPVARPARRRLATGDGRGATEARRDVRRRRRDSGPRPRPRPRSRPWPCPWPDRRPGAASAGSGVVGVAARPTGRGIGSGVGGASRGPGPRSGKAEADGDGLAAPGRPAGRAGDRRRVPAARRRGSRTRGGIGRAGGSSAVDGVDVEAELEAVGPVVAE